MKLVYLAGKYTAPSPHEVTRNIHRAWHWGVEVAKLGAYPVIPHASSAHMDDLQSPQWWYDATMELLRRCDAVYMITGWNESKGARAEYEEAKRLEKPVFLYTEDLRRWIDGSK